MKIYESIIHKLDEVHKTVATMESCTGGAVAAEITNHPGASEVLKFSAVTYSNEYKIKMGVDPYIIDEYSVYSMETAIEMAFNISKFTGADFGIGITGKINTPDPVNNFGEDDQIFVAIYDKEKDVYYEYEIDAIKNASRVENKNNIIAVIGNHLLNILNNSKDNIEIPRLVKRDR